MWRILGKLSLTAWIFIAMFGGVALVVAITLDRPERLALREDLERLGDLTAPADRHLLDDDQRDLLARLADGATVAEAARAVGMSLRTANRRLADARARVAELVEAGELTPVRVEGWDKTAFLHPEARIPRRIDARGLRRRARAGDSDISITSGASMMRTSRASMSGCRASSARMAASRPKCFQNCHLG